MKPVLPKLVDAARLTVLSGALTFGVASPSYALSALTFGTTNLSGTGTISTRGYAFNVLNPSGITVTDLSLWDENGDGLAESHDIGLWDSVGTLLASATVAAGTVNPLSANGQFRTAAIVNQFLPQGNNYVVGAVFLNGSPDGQNVSSSFTTISDIAFVSGRVINNGVASLTLPTATRSFPLSGASFEVATTPVPFEFSPTLGLSIVGGLWVGKHLIKQIKSAKAKV